MKRMIIMIVAIMVMMNGCSISQKKHCVYSVDREIMVRGDGKEQMKRAVEFIGRWTDRRIIISDENSIVTEPSKTLLNVANIEYGRLQYVVEKDKTKIFIRINTASRLSIREAEMNSLILQDYMETGKMRIAVKYITVW